MSGSPQERLTQMLVSLSPEQQNAVEAFIHYLREMESTERKAGVSSAVDAFVREHSDLLRRLAQ